MKATIAVLVAVAALISVAPADATARIFSDPVNNSTYIGNGHWGGYGTHGGHRGSSRVPRPVWDHGSWSSHGSSSQGNWPYGYHNYWGAWRTTSDGRVDPIVLK